MRRKAFALVTFALAAWACSDDYTDAETPPAPAQNDAGPTEKKDSEPPLTPSNPPAITIGKISVARGESTRAAFVVTRGGHELPLDLVASGLPAGITVAPVKLPIDTTKGEVEISAAVTTAEGSTTVELALLEGNTKLATAATIVEVGPLRAGNLDPDFGKGGVVDLDLPRSLIAFSEDGTLYVNATSGLTRWNKDGTRDTTYGPLSDLPASFTPWTMIATDGGQVYLGGYRLEGGGAKPTIHRSLGTGKGIDKNFGALGTATVASVPSANGLFNAFALGLTPTALYAVVHLEKDGAAPGPMTLARMSLAGEADTGYGTNGYLVLPVDYAAPELAFFDPIGVDHFAFAIADRLGGQPFLRLYEGTADKKLTPRLGDYGNVTAVAFDPTTSTSLVARDSDAGLSVLRVGDAGTIGSIDAGATVNVISVDAEGRPLLGGCAGNASSWGRYLPDGGVDPTYKSSTTPEMKCVLTARVTEKYIYLAGTGGTPEKLRLARLVR